MSVIIFGNGPLPGQPDQPVTAPGSRTWQIIRTVADGLAASGNSAQGITVINLDESTPPTSEPISFTVNTNAQPVKVLCYPLPYHDYIQYAHHTPGTHSLPVTPRAVVGTGSAQPYSTAAQFARANDLPLWIDVFGDPLCEIQSQAELLTDQDPKAASSKLIHVWKLFVDALLAADQLSALSHRQRFALLGQLGCAGRLNQYTADSSLVHAIPYALFPDDLPPAPAPPSDASRHFTVLWAGSFNTWMDVPTLTRGISDALLSNPLMRLVVVGGSIPGYNEVSYNQFLSGIRSAGVEGSVTLLDWQPLSAMPALYARSNLGLSIDRFTYEAELGSRTRLINFLAAGLPVASTVVTELSVDLAAAGVLLPFDLGDAGSLTNLLINASKQPDFNQNAATAARAHISKHYNARTCGSSLAHWIQNPTRSGDHQPAAKESPGTNALLLHQQNLRASLST